MPPSRFQVLDEIVTTERAYVADLRVILDLYHVPITSLAILPAESVDLVFGNTQALIDLHTSILHQIEERRMQHERLSQLLPGHHELYVGDIFMSACGMRETYTAYCRSYTAALEEISKWRKNPILNYYLLDCKERPVSRGLDLGDFIIKPVQRICKYPLLFRELLAVTEPASHPDHRYLRDALAAFEACASDVNEAMAQPAAPESSVDARKRKKMVLTQIRRVRSGSMSPVRPTQLPTVVATTTTRLPTPPPKPPLDSFRSLRKSRRGSAPPALPPKPCHLERPPRPLARRASAPPRRKPPAVPSLRSKPKPARTAPRVDPSLRAPVPGMCSPTRTRL